MIYPLVRKKGRPKVAIALSGGVARGIAHVGVLTILERHPDLQIDIVTGTSAGAIVGAAYSAGIDVCQIEKFARYANWQEVASFSQSRFGLLSFSRLEYRLMCMMGDVWFSDLCKKFAVMTTDLYSSEPIAVCEGRVVPAVRASCSVPGIFEPIKINGRYLVDGGIADNLPAELARELGADYVIGVDVFIPHLDERLGPLGAGLMGFENLIRRAGGGLTHVDHLIAPKLSGESFVRFSQNQKWLELGRQAALESLPKIKADLEL